MRIASFAHSLTDDLFADLGDADLAPIEHADHRSHRVVRLRDRHHVAPRVAGFPELRDLLLEIVHRCSSVIVSSVPRVPVERELESFARLHEREPHVIGAGRTVEIAGRHEQAGRVRELGRDLPAVVGAVVAPQPEIEGARSAVVHEAERRERRARARAVRRSARVARPTWSSSPSAATAAACIGTGAIRPACLRVSTRYDTRSGSPA